jgi:hypothetical protein
MTPKIFFAKMFMVLSRQRLKDMSRLREPGIGRTPRQASVCLDPKGAKIIRRDPWMDINIVFFANR